MERRKAVFLDLNGTLVLPVIVDRLDQLHPVDGAGEAVARLCRAGYLCPVVTVQPRLEKGFFSADEFRRWFEGFESTMSKQREGSAGAAVSSSQDMRIRKSPA